MAYPAARVMQDMADENKENVLRRFEALRSELTQVHEAINTNSWESEVIEQAIIGSLAAKVSEVAALLERQRTLTRIRELAAYAKW